MKDSEADIAIGTLEKLADREFEAVCAAARDGNAPFGSYAQTRHNAFLQARNEILKALANAMRKRDAENPFALQDGELTTMDMHTCDMCGRMCASPVYTVCLSYGNQSKTASEVCADCMRRLEFRPVKVISLDAYRRFERWTVSQLEAEDEPQSNGD